MITVAALVAGGAARALHESELAGIAKVRFCDRAADLIRLAAGGLDAVVTEPRDRDRAPVGALLAGLPARRAPTLLVVPPVAASFGEARHALATGAFDACVVRSQQTLGAALGAALASPGAPAPELSLVDGFVPLVGEPLRGAVTALALAASPALRVPTVAGWLGLSERALRDRFASAGLPNPSTVLHYFVALRAAGALAHRGWTAKRAAAALGFRCVEDLRQLVRDYAGMPTRAVASPDGYATLCGHVAAVLRGRIPPRDGRRRRRPSAATRRWHERALPRAGAAGARPYAPPAVTESARQPPWIGAT